MKKRISILILTIMVIFMNLPVSSYAENNKKVIVVNINRSNMQDFLEMPVLKSELEKSGYIGLMNIRGDQGTDDKRSYASIGAGARATVDSSKFTSFKSVTSFNKKAYESVVGKKSKEINDLTINSSVYENAQNGQYKATLGSIGQALSEKKLTTTVLGNADIGTKIEDLNRNIVLMAMDNYGRVDKGNVDNINLKDAKMPFGIKTDYTKLKEETKKAYSDSDVIFVELGDTYRLDLYKSYLNENTYNKMESTIHNNINDYLKTLFATINKDDVVYVMSAFPKAIDYKNKRSLAPIIKFAKEGKGLLISSTTRRTGIIGNVDIGVDILNNYNIQSEKMVGRALNTVNENNNVDVLKHSYEKMVSIASVRGSIIATFINANVVLWIIALCVLLFRAKFKKDNEQNKIKSFIGNDKTLKVISEIMKFGIIMPVAFLVSPLYNLNTNISITISIIITGLIIYIIGSKLFKDDFNEIGFYSIIAVLIVCIDAITGSYLMKNNILSYDAIVGARYYGIGNEYQGIVIGSSIIAMTVLLKNKKLPKILVPIISLIILFISASPTMGANVGSAISECVAFLLFTLLVYDIKIDFKKIIILGFAAVLVVVIFAILDFTMGSKSHLSLFINKIMTNGPQIIIETFSRKISMNMKLAKNSAWVNILILGIVTFILYITNIFRLFNKILDKYSYLTKAFIAIMGGALITLLVNDSGIVSAGTTAIYPVITLLILNNGNEYLKK